MTDKGRNFTNSLNDVNPYMTLDHLIGNSKSDFYEFMKAAMESQIKSPGIASREPIEEFIAKSDDQSFDQIYGNEKALSLLKDAIEAPVKHTSLYEKYGLSMPKGVLLFGPPGCGKTMFARAAVSEMKKLYGEECELINISASEIQSPYVGETEKKIRQIFQYARDYKKAKGHPLMVFIDEAEVLFPERSNATHWQQSNVATFLAEMDGLVGSGAFVMIATNRPEMIDQAVLRDGRCDLKIEIKRPNEEAIKLILKKNFEGMFTSEKIDDLVFAAIESIIDPHKVILDAHAIQMSIEELKEVKVKSFTLEDIVSGAMLASIPTRAKRLAFARDKNDGTSLGVKVKEVVDCINDLFEENKNLNHSYALNEFKQTFIQELMKQHKKKMN